MDLDNFIGTENYYKHFTGLLYTDGIHYLATEGKCFWLIDLIASYQGKLKNIPFQLWSIQVFEDKSAVITCKEDTGQPDLVKQEIPFTDFPLKSFECYHIDGILLLKSEY